MLELVTNESSYCIMVCYCITNVQGVRDLQVDGGLPASFQKAALFYFFKTSHHTHFYDEFSKRTTHFSIFLPISGKPTNVPMSKENLMKRNACLENFGPKTQPYDQHIPKPSTSHIPPWVNAKKAHIFCKKTKNLSQY